MYLCKAKKRTILYLISPDSMDVSTRCLSAKRIHIIKGCRIFGIWCKIRRHCAIYEGFVGFGLIWRYWYSVSYKENACAVHFFGNAERGAE